MSDKEIFIDNLIDKHYNEVYDKNLLGKVKNIDKIENNIKTSMNKIDSLNDMDFDFDINTLDIIQQAEQIQNRKNLIKENMYFIITSIFILSSFCLLFFMLGLKFIIYFELAVLFIMPWLLIPLTKCSLRGQKNE